MTGPEIAAEIAAVVLAVVAAAAGAVVGGVTADLWGLRAAVWAAAAITVASGGRVAARMYETHMGRTASGAR